MLSIRTERFDLVAFSLAYLDAELESSSERTNLLGVSVPEG
jgi:hypothetical protein